MIFQGPALLAYNDAEFTNSDWKGIISLGISCKEKDPLKVGRFGLGFKSVFHLTGKCSYNTGTLLFVICCEKMDSKLKFQLFLTIIGIS